MSDNTLRICAERILRKRADAVAELTGSQKYPGINGKVYFYAAEEGVLVAADVCGLPDVGEVGFPVFALHIHEGQSCADGGEEPFSMTGGHFNPEGKPHPQHAGDLPPLFSNMGCAFNMVFTSRFKLNQIIGKTVVIHEKPDDFKTQPSGDSGQKIACGVITAM